MGKDKIWGYKAKEKDMSSFFKDMMVLQALKDIVPTPIAPTKQNGSIRSKGISKRLDRLIIIESLYNGLSGIKSMIIPYFISDHQPILLSWAG